MLAATAFPIGGEGLLRLTGEDVLVDGQRLEGVGVQPTIEAPFDLRYVAGADPQLEGAIPFARLERLPIGRNRRRDSPTLLVGEG